jgi:hypothetical protein
MPQPVPELAEGQIVLHGQKQTAYFDEVLHRPFDFFSNSLGSRASLFSILGFQR